MATTNSSAAAETKKRLALAIIDFLQTSTTDGTLGPDERDSIEVATSCIADSFKVDASEASTATASGQNLVSIYSVYEKLRSRSTASTSEGGSSAAEARPSTPATPAATSAQASVAKNPEAEALKGQGNAAMQVKNYPAAIDFYTRAIAITPTNPIYLSNRAAAYSATAQHDKAVQDAELAVAADPKYTKAWSRLGLARFALGDARGSMEAYQQGIEAEGRGGSDAMKKGFETARRKVEEQDAAAATGDDDEATSRGVPGAGGAGAGMPDLASMLGGMGGGGGMPDIAAMMQNPMMRQMASQVMQNPALLGTLMNNPRLREMAGQAGAGGGGGGGMPDMASLMSDPSIQGLMQDPSIAEMARNFMGGAGAGAGGAGGAGRGAGSS